MQGVLCTKQLKMNKKNRGGNILSHRQERTNVKTKLNYIFKMAWLNGMSKLKSVENKKSNLNYKDQITIITVEGTGVEEKSATNFFF